LTFNCCLFFQDRFKGTQQYNTDQNTDYPEGSYQQQSQNPQHFSQQTQANSGEIPALFSNLTTITFA
jgi:hypothetical protein